MALDGQDKAWIRKTFQSAHSDRTNGKASGITKFLKEWGGVGALVSITLFWITIYGDFREFKGSVLARLANLENSAVAKQTVTKAASLSQKEFVASLPILKSALSKMSQDQISVPPSVITGIQSKLMATKDSSPSYWPAVAEFVSFRSTIASSGNLGRNMPNCTDSDPVPITVTGVGPSGDVKSISLPYYENCQVMLDSPEQDARLLALSRSVPTIVFRNCLITYSGGAFALPVWVDMDNAQTHTSGKGSGLTLTYHGPFLQFQNCIIRFSATKDSPANGKKLIRDLNTLDQASFDQKIRDASIKNPS